MTNIPESEEKINNFNKFTALQGNSLTVEVLVDNSNKYKFYL